MSLVIRFAQQEALRDARLRSFVEELLPHVRRFFPERCEALGEVGTRAQVSEALRESLRHGITTQRGACKVVNLAFALGLDTLRQPWAADILSNGALAPGERVMRVRELAAERARGGPRV